MNFRVVHMFITPRQEVALTLCILVQLWSGSKIAAVCCLTGKRQCDHIAPVLVLPDRLPVSLRSQLIILNGFI